MKAYLKKDSDQVIWSEKRIPSAEIVEIGKVVVPFLISIWPWKKKVNVPTSISKGGKVSNLTIVFRDTYVAASYLELVPNASPIVFAVGDNEKEARKALHKELVDRGFIV